MSRASQRKAAATQRKRSRARGHVRIEIQVPRADVPLLRDVARQLRSAGTRAEAARLKLRSVLTRPEPRTVLEMFASDLPDEYFEGVFDHVRTVSRREIDL